MKLMKEADFWVVLRRVLGSCSFTIIFKEALLSTYNIVYSYILF